MIGIIGAMEVEITGLLQEMENVEEIKIFDLVFYKGVLRTKKVVLVRCGIGKVNAGRAATMLIGQFNVNIIINTGVAGGINPNLNIGDIVISDSLIQYDINAQIFGYSLGQMPGVDTSFFKANDNLIKIAKEKANQVFKNKNLNVSIGKIGTADKFVDSAHDKAQIAELFNVDCVEMEGGAIAQICYLSDTPFVVIRAISDKADGDAPEVFTEFVDEAAQNSGMLVKAMLEAI